MIYSNYDKRIYQRGKGRGVLLGFLLASVFFGLLVFIGARALGIFTGSDILLGCNIIGGTLETTKGAGVQK